MSDQPYEGYEGYEGHDPYSGQRHPHPHSPYPEQQPYPQQPYPEQQQYPQQPYPQQPHPGQQPYAQQPYPEQQQYPQQPYPQQSYPQERYPQAHGHEQHAAQDQYLQQWEGQTWETQAQPPVAVDVTETAYLPLQGEAPAPVAARSAAPASEEGPTYGRATTTGNARVTDAQRARAEGRSPVIEPGMQPAALTAVLGLLLAAGAAVGQYALLVPLVILQAVTAAGWFRLNGMWPARQGIALAFLGGVAADAALLAVGEEHAPAAILGTLGVWVLLVLVLQLRSRAGADERMYGLMATVVSAALAIIAAGHLAAAADAVTVGCVAVAAAILARALPLPTPASVVVALLAATGAGLAAGGMTDLGTKGALLALGAGVCALVGHRVASYDYPSRFVHMTAGVALPLAAAAPAVYVLGRAIG
ncbi:hypothetical protein [Streptomyces sp. NPDC023327]|uniref:hypothetical protein n=1 Tax=Streptomyces sp. NPDC023327 TaxID=3157088 RepID=UPI0033FA2780